MAEMTVWITLFLCRAGESRVRPGKQSHELLWDSYLIASRNEHVDLLWGTVYTESQ